MNLNNKKERINLSNINNHSFRYLLHLQPNLCGIQKNKKAEAFSELILITLSIIIIGFCLFIAGISVNNSKEQYKELTIEISYKFPQVFIHTFLYQEIDKEDLKNLNLSIKGKTYVKDLIYINTKKSLDLIKSKYILKYKNLIGTINSKSILNDYNYFANENLKLEDLIVIKSGLSTTEIPKLEEAINNKNYFFYIKTKTGEYTTITFK